MQALRLEPELFAELEALACVHQDCDAGRMARLLVLKSLRPGQFAEETSPASVEDDP